MRGVKGRFLPKPGVHSAKAGARSWPSGDCRPALPLVVIGLGSQQLYCERARIAAAALERRRLIVGQLALAEVGGLLGFGPELKAALQGAADYADRVME